MSLKKVRNLLKEDKIDDVLDFLENKDIDVDLANDVTLLRGKISSLKRKLTRNTISEEGYDKEMSKIRESILTVGEEMEEKGFFSKELNPLIKKDEWLESDLKRESIAHSLAEEFDKLQSREEKKSILKKFTTICLDNYQYYPDRVKDFASIFDERIKLKEFFYDKGKELNLYKLLISIFRTGIPKVPHFFGLLNIPKEELFTKPELLISLEILNTIENKGYEDALIVVNNYEDILEKLVGHTIGKDYYFYYYLLGQVYRKNNLFEDALSEFDRGIVLVNDELENNSWNNLLLSEFYRGIATVKRKQIGRATNSTDKEKFLADALMHYTIAEDVFKNLKRKRASGPFSIAAKKVESDVFFSHGYYLFEIFFKNCLLSKGKSQNVDEEIEKINEIVNLFKSSNGLNPKLFTAPLSRKAILYLYQKKYDLAIRDFISVFKEDQRFLSKKNDNERRLTLIWTSLALYHIKNSIKNFNLKKDISIRDINVFIKNTFEKDEINISKGPIECHTFDLNVIDNIFKMHGSPIENPELRAIIKRMNDELCRISEKVSAIAIEKRPCKKE